MKGLLRLLGALCLCAIALTQGLIADSPKEVATKLGIKELRFAAIPVVGSGSLEEFWKPVITHLQKEFGVKITMKYVGDYAALITGMQHKHIDIAYLGPESYVQAAARAGAVALVTEKNASGIAGYHSIIITKKGSGLNTIEDLKGKTWAFTDPNSTSGTLVPSLHFKKLGIDPQKYFSKVIYSGGHEASILSVKAGRLDGASSNDLDFEKALGRLYKAEDFNVIWTSDLIVGSAIAGCKDLPNELLMAIQEALLGLNEDKNALVQMKNGGFVRAQDSDYDVIRELIKAKGK